MKSSELLPEELDKTLNSLEFDDEAGMLIESISYSEADLYLTFSIRFDEDTARQLWRVTINGIADEFVTRDWTQSINIYNEHPLLLEYSDRYTELYFKGTTDNSEALFIEIFESLMQMADNVTDISDYLFSPERVKELSQQGYGLFARGPKTILKLYEQCLIKQGIKPIFIGEKEPSLENRSLKLLKLGKSYFIAKNFVFERQQ